MRCIITKYALTTGVFTTEARACDSDGMINAGRSGYYHTGEWHTDPAAAIARVEAMLVAAKRNTQKKLDRLAAMNATALVESAG